MRTLVGRLLIEIPSTQFTGTTTLCYRNGDSLNLACLITHSNEYFHCIGSGKNRIPNVTKYNFLVTYKDPLQSLGLYSIST